MSGSPEHARARVVAFDLGSVLVDVRKQTLATALGLPWERVEPAFFAGDRHDRLAAGSLSAGDYLAGAARQLEVAAGEVEAAWRSFVRVSPGARELVEQVRVDVVAWSNTDDVHFDVMRPGLPERLWRRRALSQELRAAKPSPVFFERALARLQRPAADVVFLDDLADNVAAARGLGIDAERVVGVLEARRALLQRGLL